MAKYKNVFSPFKFGNVEVKNRIATPPMLCSMTTSDGLVTRELIEFYQSFARGGAGIVTLGDAVVDYDYAPGHFGQLNLGSDKVISGLASFVEAIQKYGAQASVEINHAGRWAAPKFINGKNPIGPSSIPSEMEEMLARLEGRKRISVTEMNQDMIDQVIDNYANSCLRCMQAGFEMVMIHGGHGHLLAQFVSPSSNKRTDNYGGSLENRARFVVEILEAIRKKIGNGLALEYRASGDELVAGGMHEEETIEFIKIIQDKIDLVNVTVGVLADPKLIHHHIQPLYLPHAYNVHRAERIRKAVGIPVTCVGSIIDLEMADKIIAEGKADIVAMGRAHLADPEIVNKTYRGKPDNIRPCLRCCICMDQVRQSLPIRCVVNPVLGREIEYKYIKPAEKRRKIAIVGGGPAGMEAALIASSRGHTVTLYEKEKELGGTLRYAAAPSFKSDMKRYLDWMIRQTMKSPVEVKLSTKATTSTIKAARPDAIIVAVGAEPFIPDITGIKRPNVITANDVHSSKPKIGKKVVVAGAGLTGCETALHLAQQGKKVTVIDIITEPEIAKDLALLSKIALMELLQQNGVEFRTEVKLEAITNKGVAVSDNKWNRFEIPAETIVLALGVKNRQETKKQFEGLAQEVYLIGDCSKPRNLMAAVHDAFHIAVEI